MSKPLDDRPATSCSNPLKNELEKNTSDFNKAKVNSWVESETAQDGDKQELFHLSPHAVAQRNIRISDSVGTRPQSEPGRSRDTNLITGAAPQSAHDVTSSFPAIDDNVVKEDSPEEDWVIVEKSSRVTTPCEADDSILACSAQEISADAKDESKTRMALSNKFGSTFEVLPRISESTIVKNEPDTRGQITTSSPVPSRHQRPFSLGQIGAFATAITKWKLRKGKEVREKVGFETLELEHQKILKSEADNIKTEVPEAMMKTIKEEAYRVVLKTTQAYRSQIGPRHKLTREAYEYIKELREELHKP